MEYQIEVIRALQRGYWPREEPSPVAMWVSF